jgi:hypothetical protein
LQAPALINRASGEMAPANANWSLIDQPIDLFSYDEVFTAYGLESGTDRSDWIACAEANVTAEIKASCQQEALADILRFDVAVLQALAQITQV